MQLVFYVVLKHAKGNSEATTVDVRFELAPESFTKFTSLLDLKEKLAAHTELLIGVSGGVQKCISRIRARVGEQQQQVLDEVGDPIHLSSCISHNGAVLKLFLEYVLSCLLVEAKRLAITNIKGLAPSSDLQGQKDMLAFARLHHVALSRESFKHLGITSLQQSDVGEKEKVDHLFSSFVAHVGKQLYSYHAGQFVASNLSSIVDETLRLVSMRHIEDSQESECNSLFARMVPTQTIAERFLQIDLKSSDDKEVPA